MSEPERLALSRLINIAKRDTGQSRRVADFLLAWWTASQCGGFDLADLFAVDYAIAANMITVSAAIARLRNYPDTLGFRKDFEAILRCWRREVVSAA